MQPIRDPQRSARAAAALLGTRWIVRAPIWAYRARLGALFGSRLVLLEHRGRVSGARRYVVLEVVATPGPNTVVVASGFGARAQWYRNIQVDPHVRVTRGSHRSRPALARALDSQQSADALGRYARAHPRAWRRLRPVFEATLGTPITDQHTDLPLIAFDLR